MSRPCRTIRRAVISRQLDAPPDSKAHLPDTDDPNAYYVHARPDSIPVMYDIPIGLVNRVMYGGGRERHTDRRTDTATVGEEQ